MIFQLGALFLLGSATLSVALPPCVCNKNLKPVCGSDGQMYSNECVLECAQRSDPQLFMERTGRCDGTSLGPPRDVRQVQEGCTICTLEYMPLCGTDGTTYPNRCSFNCAKKSDNVEVAYPGECRNKREIAQVCSCAQEANPVCGTDGNTYENSCKLKCAKDINEDLEILYVGECDNNVKVLSPQECEGCTRKVKPVCGTDGNTYRNPCMVNCARDNDETLHIYYEGICNDDADAVEGAKKFPCGCKRTFKPVCASNGVSFSNKCLMKCADTNLTVAKDGFCGE